MEMRMTLSMEEYMQVAPAVKNDGLFIWLMQIATILTCAFIGHGMFMYF